MIKNNGNVIVSGAKYNPGANAIVHEYNTVTGAEVYDTEYTSGSSSTIRDVFYLGSKTVMVSRLILQVKAHLEHLQ